MVNFVKMHHLNSKKHFTKYFVDPIKVIILVCVCVCVCVCVYVYLFMFIFVIIK
jgi:hypothetical protein